MRILLFLVAALIATAGDAQAQRVYEPKLSTNTIISDIDVAAATTAVQIPCSDGGQVLFTNNSANTVYVEWGTTQEGTSASSGDVPLMGDRQSLFTLPRAHNWISARSKSGDNVTIEVMCGSGM